MKEKHEVFFEETSGELILPLPKGVIVHYMGEISIYNKLKNTDGAEKSVSSSLITSFRLQPYTILARTYLHTASTLQCSQTLDPFTIMHTYMDLYLAHPLEA